MPIYEYECGKCGAIEEAFQKFSDKPLATCKACKGKLHKLMSQSTFHLKGSGWYVTDYAGKSSGNSSSSKKQENTSKSTDSAVAVPQGGTKSASKKSSSE
ncbi:MAG: zinc ribbon domain-containing protein [Pseudomonadota bacterium]